MKCAICGNQITKGFTNPKSHKLGCPIFVNTKKVADVIIKEIKKSK